MASRGDIVIIPDLLDPQGRDPKPRPCVIVSSPVAIASGGTLMVVAITTQLPNPLTPDHVPLPWAAQGHPRTGLNKPNAAACSWLVEIEPSRIGRKLGHVPPKPMLQIAAVLRSLQGRDPD
jgi:mRNA-degrading endonuclease toxin of MazEF toxin-antitoxin module